MAEFKERRSSPKKGKASVAPAAKRPAPQVLVDASGFHTMDAIREFIEYDLDGSAQTEWNERFVMPLCVAVIAVDDLAKLENDQARNRVQAKVGEALRKLTRRADRLARSGDEYVVLLRRTLSKKAHDFYLPNARKAIAEASGDGTTISAGISSLTEHMVKGADDMIKKAFSALAAARKHAPGSAMVYDFRTMPY
jgi:GGDEF domain-containing protein